MKKSLLLVLGLVSVMFLASCKPQPEAAPVEETPTEAPAEEAAPVEEAAPATEEAAPADTTTQQ